MGNFSPFQQQKSRPSTATQSSFAPQVRPSTPAPSPSPVTTPHNEQASLEHAHRFREGIEQMSIYPSEQNAAPHVHRGQQTADAIQRKRSLMKQMMQQQGRNEIQEPHHPRKKNMTGLPDTLKAGVESLSGLSLDDVHVHYNSSKPAQLEALAYTQGTDIHVGQGQERHLAHEAWHVVQQKQGRVKPTLQTKGGVINDDQELEQEADIKSRQVVYHSWSDTKKSSQAVKAPVRIALQNTAIQRKIAYGDHKGVSKYHENAGAWLEAFHETMGFRMESLPGYKAFLNKNSITLHIDVNNTKKAYFQEIEKLLFSENNAEKRAEELNKTLAPNVLLTETVHEKIGNEHQTIILTDVDVTPEEQLVTPARAKKVKELVNRAKAQIRIVRDILQRIDPKEKDSQLFIDVLNRILIDPSREI
jgi:hypothetical protein